MRLKTIIMLADPVKNYSHCPLKKRPILLNEKEDDIEEICENTKEMLPTVEQSEPEDLSVSRKRKPEITSIPEIKKCKSPVTELKEKKNSASFKLSNVKIEKSAEEFTKIKEESPVKLNSNESPYKNWPCPLTPPSSHYPTPNENLEPFYLPPLYPSRFEPYGYSKDELLFKPHPQLPLYPPYNSSVDLRTNFNNNVIKSDTFMIPKYFTPYRVDHSTAHQLTNINNNSLHYQSHPPHRPLFNVFPLSPASSHASINSYEESPRRSESPLSTQSVTSDNQQSQISMPTVTSTTSNYSVFRDVSALSTGAPNPKSKQGKSEKLKSSHYQCPDCSKSYSTYSGLSKHQQFHCPAVEGNQAKKIFSCKNCDKVYTSLGALKMHIRTHTLPCKCEICGKAFSRPWLLQGHIRTHTGEKPFSCQHCHRAFADRSNLRAHLQTHSEIKKYSCTTCSKTFSRMSLLTKHLEGGCPGITQIPPHSVNMYEHV